METGPTQVSTDEGKHPTLAQLRDPSAHEVAEHLDGCAMCRALAASDDVPIVLELPKGLVSETAFRWPGEPIARGGMAEIFAGEDRRLSRTVILKAPRDGDELPAGMAELFQRRVTAEARILAKLQHPSIVKIYELGRATVGWPFCVLERVEGVSLRDKLDELLDLEADGRPRTRERLELLAGLVAIAEAMAYAHERRVVHRDITPNNILLGKRGEATLIDWGIARDLDAPGTSGELLDMSPSTSGRMVTMSAGTPPYLPLEQSQGRAADPSFDVYSFGVTLYEVVSGKTPFEWRGVDGPSGRQAQLEQFLRWLRDGGEAAPASPRDAELSGIIARAIAHEPSERFTADELVRALKQYLTGELVFSHRYSLSGRLARWMRTHRAATVTLAFLVASVVSGALVWAQLSRRAREEADLQAIAAQARADASEKGRAADDATRAAEQARAEADQAEAEGKDAKAKRAEAERKRKAAEQMRADAEAAATQAKGDADDAMNRFKEAMKAKDDADKARAAAEADRAAAQAAQAAAEKDRDAAKAAQASADKDRAAAKQAQLDAEKARDVAKAAATGAEAERDAARAAQGGAEKDRDAARAGQGRAEQERDAAVAARRKVSELEARLKELEQRGGPPAPPPAGSGAP
jgi:tRNA A-37 threonylcarbamoyl transferase component Bud32